MIYKQDDDEQESTFVGNLVIAILLLLGLLAVAEIASGQTPPSVYSTGRTDTYLGPLSFVAPVVPPTREHSFVWIDKANSPTSLDVSTGGGWQRGFKGPVLGVYGHLAPLGRSPRWTLVGVDSVADAMRNHTYTLKVDIPYWAQCPCKTVLWWGTHPTYDRFGRTVLDWQGGDVVEIVEVKP